VAVQKTRRFEPVKKRISIGGLDPFGLSEIELQKDIPEDTRADLEKIYRSGSNLLGIINDVLDIFRIETGTLELVPEAYYLSDLINDTVQLTTVETLVSGLNELLEKVEKNKGKKQRAGAPDPNLLDRLLEACKQYKLALMEDAVAELENYEYDSGGDLVVWLRDQLDNLEYDAIQDRLETQNSLSKNGSYSFTGGKLWKPLEKLYW
jgi:hypothetical protein